MSEEEAKVAEIKETVAERQKRCDEDLVKAEPAVRQAEAALDTLNKVRHSPQLCNAYRVTYFNVLGDNPIQVNPIFLDRFHALL